MMHDTVLWIWCNLNWSSKVSLLSSYISLSFSIIYCIKLPIKFLIYNESQRVRDAFSIQYNNLLFTRNNLQSFLLNILYTNISFWKKITTTMFYFPVSPFFNNKFFYKIKCATTIRQIAWFTAVYHTNKISCKFWSTVTFY